MTAGHSLCNLNEKSAEIKFQWMITRWWTFEKLINENIRKNTDRSSKVKIVYKTNEQENC